MAKANSLFQYQEIARELREEILRGEFRDEGRLPSERKLTERFQVQRNTVRQALALLEHEGHIATEGKRGSFVRDLEPKVVRNVFLMNIHGGASPMLTYLTDGFSDVVGRAGFSVRRFNTSPAEGAALEPLPEVSKLGRDAAGIVLWPQNPADPDALLRLNASIPLVLVDRRVLGVSIDCVRFDDVAGGRMVTDHLLQQGHRRIGFLTDDVFAETVQHRWHGYALSLEAAGLPVDPRLSVFFRGIHEPFFTSSMRGLFSLGKDAPTAVVCSNDLVAFMLLRYLRDEGIRVPDDVAVTGYGNAMPDYGEAMALTSVHQPFEELGRRAATTLLERLGESGDERLRETRDIKIPVRLVVRKSSSA
jgi:GntR family transcriptional regulator of arabinose operon